MGGSPDVWVLSSSGRPVGLGVGREYPDTWAPVPGQECKCTHTFRGTVQGAACICNACARACLLYLHCVCAPVVMCVDFLAVPYAWYVHLYSFFACCVCAAQCPSLACLYCYACHMPASRCSHPEPLGLAFVLRVICLLYTTCCCVACNMPSQHISIRVVQHTLSALYTSIHVV